MNDNIHGLDFNVMGTGPGNTKPKESREALDMALRTIGPGYCPDPNKRVTGFESDNTRVYVPKQEPPISFSFKNAQFLPDNTTDFNKPCKFRVELVPETPGVIADKVVRYELWTLYNGKDHALQVVGKIEPKKNIAETTIKLFTQDDYITDTVQKKKTGCSIEYYLKLSMYGAKPDKSKPLKMPYTKGGEKLLKRGTYDDTSDTKNPRSGDNYIASQDIHDLQEKLIKIEVAEFTEPTGSYGLKTEKAVKDFQTLAAKQERMKKGSKDVTKENDVYKGDCNGVADQNTLNELDKWISKGWIKPVSFQPIQNPAINDNQNAGPEPKWIAIAKKEIGTQEIAGEEDNPRIIEYFGATNIDKSNKNDETAWCSAFANWVLQKAGYDGTKDAHAFSWKNWGKKVDKPCYGALAICSYSHVGFVVGKRTYPVDREGVLLLGGNQGKKGMGKVCVSWFPVKDIIAYIVPNDLNDINYNLTDTNDNAEPMNYSTTH